MTQTEVSSKKKWNAEKIIDTICSYSVGVSYPAINSSDFGIIPLCFPSTAEEQKLILGYIDNSVYSIYKLIDKIQSQISLLQEYRTTLISEVVTGKIDVRDWNLKQEN